MLTIGTSYAQMGRDYEEESGHGWISWVITLVIIILAIRGLINGNRS